MNVFKVLASGNSRLKEPHISAFLGYVLDPKADHGIGGKFLELFLEPLIIKYENKLSQLIDPTDRKKVTNLGYQSLFDVQIHYEKKVGSEIYDPTGKLEKTEIVDIILIISKKSANQLDFHSILLSNTPVAMILIENKISGIAFTPVQVKNQYDKTIRTLERIVDGDEAVRKKLRQYEALCFSVYITPEHIKFDNETNKYFSGKDKTRNGINLVWNAKNTETSSIANMFDKLLIGGQKENAAPIHEYTRHTLNAFKNFIYEGFKNADKAQNEYSDFDEFRKYCTYYRDFSKSEWIKELHENIIKSYFFKGDKDENEFLKITTRTIAYNVPRSTSKIFHIAIYPPNQVEIFFRSETRPEGSNKCISSGRKNTNSWLCKYRVAELNKALMVELVKKFVLSYEYSVPLIKK